MGSFYTNITLKTTQHSAVLDALKAAHRDAFVSRAENGCVVVCDRATEDQDIEELNALASSLSGTFRCTAFAVLNHDDDVLVCTLHDKGELVDEYNSSPDYFNTGEFGPAEGGDASLLARLFGAKDAARVDAVLRGEEYDFASDRHEALVTALGLPALSVGAGYNYVDEGDLADPSARDAFESTG